MYTNQKKRTKEGITITEEALKKENHKVNTKNIYNSPFFSNRNINQRTKELFIGKECMEIVKKQNHMDIFHRYLQSVMNNTYGFLIDQNFTNCSDVCDRVSAILTYIFKSILDYNKIQTYPNILLCESYKSIIFGEPMTYSMDKRSCKLKLLFFMPCIAHILASNTSYSIRFSDDITKESCFKDSLSIVFGDENEYDSSGDHDIELQNLIMKLFIISDHAATHFIEEYKTGNTDWVNHQCFGKMLKGEIITYNTVFDISANITVNAPKPIIISGGGKNNSNREFTFNNLTVPSKYFIRPLQQIHENIANLMPLEY